MEERIRSDLSVWELRSSKGRIWQAIRWIHRRRPLLTALLVLIAPAHTLVSGAEPVDLLSMRVNARFLFAWILMLFGFGVRLWGSGNLRKNQEITCSGIYVLVRHPLYVGSLAFFLAYFLTVGDLKVGLTLFGLLLLLVYYPTMLGEEEYLTLKFPGQFSRYSPPPRLFPDLRRLPEAMRTDRFDFTAAYRNLGFRGGWFILALPLFLRLLDWIQTQIPA